MKLIFPVFTPCPSWHHSDPYTKVQDWGLKIAASARSPGTTTRQLRAAGRTHGTRGCPATSPGPAPGHGGATIANFENLCLWISFRSRSALHGVFSRTPTHPLWQTHTQSLELALPVRAKDSTQRARGQPHASTLAIVKRQEHTAAVAAAAAAAEEG